MRRRNLTVHDASPSSEMSFVKQGVREVLGGSPDEMALLVGGEVAPDSAKLSEYGLRSGSHALVVELDQSAPDVWDWEGPHGGADADTSLRSALTEECIRLGTETNNLPADLTVLESEWPLEVSRPKQGRRQSPPPLLRRGSWKKCPSTDRMGSEGKLQGVQEGSLFKLSVHMKVFLGEHCHQRCCWLRVSADTRVAEVEERLQQWLGSPPDELVVMLGETSLDGERSLEQVGITGAADASALAWYKHARCADRLPADCPS